MVLIRRGARIMFVRYDRDRNRLVGGNWFVGIRLDHKDRVPPQFYKIGQEANYDGNAGWKLDE